MQLETERLLLREFTATDWPAVHAYESDPLVARYMPWAAGGETASRAHLQRCLDYAQETPRRVYELAIVRKADGQLIGECTLALNPHEPRQAAFSYLLNRQDWGHGYATEAMKRLFDFGFDDLGLVRLADSVDARNRASQRVLEKLGLRREGYLRAVNWDNDAWHDEVLYAILAREWRPRSLEIGESPLVIERWTADQPRWPALDALVAELKQTDWVAFTADWHLSSTMLVAHQGKEIMGFLRFVIQPIGVEEDLSPVMLRGQILTEGKVLAFGVAPTYRRQGIGRQLQERLITDCRGLGCHQLRSHSSAKNGANHQLKLAMGFAIHPLPPDQKKDGAYFLLPLTDDYRAKENA
jgi:RimJ/RimL family protein N-acetyltransferase